MKIGPKKPAQASPSRLMWAGALILVFVAGWLAGDRGWAKAIQAYRPLSSLAVGSAPPPESLPTLVVDMSYTAYDDILAQRAGALQAGVVIPSAQDFVTATIRLDAATIPVRMRLLAGPADHLGEDAKWGFEVRTRNNQQLLGMQRFYLLDPAVNNWLNQWAFARALEREGILVARYQFVHLIFNGNDRGIVALQEGFGSELMAAQGRPAGVIVEFDADLLWKSMAHFQGQAQAAYADPVANLAAADFQYFEVDTFRDAAIAGDPELSTQKDRAIGLLRALQAGTLTASDVFDVERYARFLALVDVWGATRATSLVNLRYYYDPTTGRLEPVGFNANALGSDTRLSLAATYDDPALQAAYAREALRLSQADYVDQLQAELESEFRRWQQALSSEYGELAPPWPLLHERQEQIRRSLDPLQPVFAYLGSPSLAMSGTLRIEVGSVLNLPVEIAGFDIGGATFLPAERRWLQSESTTCLSFPAGADATPSNVILRAFDAGRTPVICYAHFDIPLAQIHRLDGELDYMQEIDIQVATRIWGLSTLHLTPARRGYPDILFVGGQGGN